ncbi:DedA family protein [Limnoraphis robusta]|uniref:DedA family protein n=1 Tax=Limnoraphis robusta CCNP1315 TaxID=3110306 RepID=A0ABU5TZF9_9CYAN|nr:DedA family protein [Limnoraphis robusta]MEA5520321.1 DedA family protein [Limnoraphis robusta CCNP1315]MEA5548318.1 DedA family protein [Limnoraphis robusta CCNP1324]
MLDWITQGIASWGYMGILLLMFLENIFPPIPSEVIMPLAGFTIAQGQFNFLGVILSGVMGSILGALPWYYFGKNWGEKKLKEWIEKRGQWLTLSTEDLERSQQWFRHYGNWVVLLGRVIPGIRTYISIPAGLEKMPIFSFLVYSTLGTIIWISFLTVVGYWLGDNYILVEEFMAPISIIVFVILFFAVFIWFLKRKKQQ